MIARRLAAAMLAASFAASPALSAELTEEQQADASDFALNNSIFVFQHEVGHLYVHEFGLPVLGKEEDAADGLAAITLLASDSEEAQQTLMDSADGWWMSENAKAGESYEEADFYDEHSLDIQRSFQIVCFMVGADPEAFAGVADDYGIDEDRRESCGADYEGAAASWDQLLAPHVGTGAGQKVSVTYEDSDNFQGVVDLLKSARFLEDAAENLQTGYNLPRDISFVATECGEENAFYSEEDGSVTFCYEMFEYFATLYEDELKKGK